MQAPVAVFPTKVDRWLVVVLLGAVVVEVSGALVALRTSPPDAFLRAVMVASFLAPIAIVSLLAVPTRYELYEDELVIRSGVVRYHVPYRDLVEVWPSHNLLSAPAWSLDRLKLVRTQGYALISPRDKDGFLRELRLRAPHVRIGGKMQGSEGTGG